MSRRSGNAPGASRSSAAWSACSRPERVARSLLAAGSRSGIGRDRTSPEGGDQEVKVAHDAGRDTSLTRKPVCRSDFADRARASRSGPATRTRGSAPQSTAARLLAHRDRDGDRRSRSVGRRERPIARLSIVARERRPSKRHRPPQCDHRDLLVTRSRLDGDSVRSSEHGRHDDRRAEIFRRDADFFFTRSGSAVTVSASASIRIEEV